MKLDVSNYLIVNNIYKEYHTKLKECFVLIEECYWDLQEVYDETKVNYKYNENNCATLPYGLWKFYLIEECIKEIEEEKGKGIYSLSCDNFFFGYEIFSNVYCKNLYRVIWCYPPEIYKLIDLK